MMGGWRKRERENQELLFNITGTILNFAFETFAFMLNKSFSLVIFY